MRGRYITVMSYLRLVSPYVTHTELVSSSLIKTISRSQWPRGLRRRCASTRLLRSWVRILRRAWMSVSCECCVLSGRGLCDELIARPEEPYRLWCVVVCFLVIVLLDTQILFNVFIYLFIVFYMFRACHALHQEKKIVSIQLLVIVTPCWWQCRVLVGGKLVNVVTITRSCIDTICFSWWWAWHARNM